MSQSLLLGVIELIGLIFWVSYHTSEAWDLFLEVIGLYMHKIPMHRLTYLVQATGLDPQF